MAKGRATEPPNWPCIECGIVCEHEVGYVEHVREAHPIKWDVMQRMEYMGKADRPGKIHAPAGGWPGLAAEKMN